MRKFEISRINPYSVVNDLLNNILSIILAAIIAFVGCFVFLTYLLPKEYTSKMLVSVNLSGYTSQSTSLSLARTVSIAEKLDDVMKSDAMVRVAENELGETVEGIVDAKQMPDTNLIEVTATESTPDRAYEVLKTIADNHYQVTDYSFTNVIIRIISNPTVPTGPSNVVSVFSSCLIFAFAAAMLVTVIIFFMSFTRDTIKNVSDVEIELKAKLFGTINHFTGFGKKLPDPKRRLILSNTFVGYDFTESFRRMAIKIESLYRTKGINAIMVTSTAENEGKTTVSVNLAVALAHNSHKVLLIDCDFRKPAVKFFFDQGEALSQEEVDAESQKDFHKFLQDGGNINDFVRYDATNGIYLLHNILNCAQSAEKLASPRFAETIRALKKQFDYIVLDTPPSGIIVDAEIIAGVVDAALLVVRQDYVNVTSINDQLEAINKNYVAGCILNDIRHLKLLPGVSNDVVEYNTGINA